MNTASKAGGASFAGPTGQQIKSLDDLSFLGPTPPLEVRRGIAILLKAPAQDVRKILNLVINHIHGEEVTTEIFLDEIRDSSLDQNVSTTVFTGLYTLFRLAIRKRISAQKFKVDLNEFRIPVDVLGAVVETYTKWFRF